jgi:hypothetical protein
VITSYTVYANHPRLWFRDTDVSAITARTNSGSSWQAFWDGTLVPGAASIESTQAFSTIAANDSVSEKMYLLALTGRIDSISANKTKAIGLANYLAANWGTVGAEAKWSLIAMAQCFDILYADLTGSDKTTIGNAILAACDSMRYATDEYVHGTTSGQQMAQLIGSVAIHGDVSGASTRIDEALGWFYGSTPGGRAAFETLRYYGANGGLGKGTWYSSFDGRYELYAIEAIAHAFSAIAQDSVAYDPYVDETWIAKIGEWMLNVMIRGDLDYWAIGDTFRTSNPFYHVSLRHVLSILVTRGGTFRKQIRWLHDTLQSKTASLGQSAHYERAAEIVFWDPADASNASVHPKDAGTPISKARLFSPPGFFVGRSSWDYPNACIIALDAPERYFRGHGHLSHGGIGITVKDDTVLLPSTGLYNTSDSAALFGGTHHRYWLQQSIAHSGVVLVDDGVTTHSNYASNNALTVYPSGKGGQLWKRVSTKRTPSDVNEMRNDNGGLAWLIGSISMISSDATHSFIVRENRRAYQEQYTDQGTAAERVLSCEVKDLIIWDVPPWPIVLRMARVKSRLASFKKRDQWHFARSPVLTSTRCSALGYRQTGKIVIDYYQPENLTFDTFGGGGTDGNGYAINQFNYDNANHPPANAANSRHQPDLGTYRMEVYPFVPTQENWMTCLLMPMAATDSPVAYTWFETALYIGVSISGRQFSIHKTASLAQIDASDTTPPGIVTGVACDTGPANGAITASWNASPEADLANYRLYYRTHA